MNRSRKKSASPKQAGSTLRIVGGSHRGRKLPIPELEGLRPTADRIRETLFNWLQFDINGMKVIDLFAGTGALGLESLSRGAASAVFVEPQSAAASAIRQSLATLNQSNAEVVAQKAEVFLNGYQETADLIFVDPPFALNLWDSILTQLLANGTVAENGYVYVECPKNQQIQIPDELETIKDKTAGQVRFRLLKLTAA
ncbi:16S rRNA (guanine(966)-N(2))-methyltransferase RsmD [Reinekea marinisedimentorum]|uniref:Ribosomal RNA small subunit methyltransferase D n=1 Tax=Reinekea marinisedimentorum TaxID=230495 RepID=A0A4R3HVP9_9GAMM|nr:16S rRNA (guanine(966)-N(2))-methyltransferase RsmD [Reinekea marinisedimentorum]TCS37192.1 16S rRNA (guanine966-N2)-methyltransferase [Reinekea marinisedimentorum]